MQIKSTKIVFFSLAIIGAIIDILSKYWIFLVWSIIIISPQFIFECDFQPIQDLSKGIINSDLRKKCAEHQIHLSNQPLIIKYKYQNKYWIRDKNKGYFAVINNKKLKFYAIDKKIPMNYYEVGSNIFAPATHKPIQIIPYCLNLAPALNLGAVWSSFYGQTSMLTIFSIIAIIFILYLILKNDYNIKYQISLGLISAGAIGNLWDRINYGGVRDFIHAYYKSYHWPIFNIADMFIVIGITLFILVEYFNKKSSSTQSDKISKTKSKE